MLNAEGIDSGRDRLHETLKEAGLLVRRRRSYRRTTDSQHGFKVYKNLVRDKRVERAEEVLVSDITYLETTEGFCYLSLVTDLYSRKILGYEVSRSLSIEGSLKALETAVSQLKDPRGTIHHSDRGIQYCSKAYVQRLERSEMKISMTERDHVYENALAERVNGILKDEFMLGERLASYEIARTMVKEAVEIYNNERLHMSLDYVTPHQKHNA